MTTSILAREAMVERLAVAAQRHPARYRLALALLAATGFAVLGGSLVLSLALAAGIVVLLVVGKAWALLKLAFVPLAFAWMVLKSLWVKFEPPQGHRLAAGEAPDLAADVERLRLAAGAPRLAGIVIDNDLNAAAVSVPRLLGLLGHRHYLLVGLPLLQRLDRRQFAAVVAHEFGHFGGGHGSFSGWIHRVRTSWLRVRMGLGDGSWAARPLIRFFDWYAPYFSAYSYVFARSNEYEADRIAARIAGADVAAQALVSVQLAAMRLQRDFWPELQRSNRHRPEPPASLYADMRGTLVSTAADDAARLEELLQRRPDLDDSHPVLAQRLAALGQPAALPPLDAPDRADALLGPLRDTLVARFGTEWRERVADDWRQSHEAAAVQGARLAELEQLRRVRVLTEDEIAERAGLAVELAEPGTLDVEAELSAALEAAPRSAPLGVRRGLWRLDHGDARGEADLELALSLDADCEELVLERLYAWHFARGGLAAAAPIVARWETFGRRMQEARLERAQLLPGDRYLPHDLDEASLDRLRVAVKSAGGVGKLWIARKQLRHDAGMPHYVVRVDWRMFTHASTARLQRLSNALPLDGSWIVATKAGLGRSRAGFMRAARGPVFASAWFG